MALAVLLLALPAYGQTPSQPATPPAQASQAPLLAASTPAPATLANAGAALPDDPSAGLGLSLNVASDSGAPADHDAAVNPTAALSDGPSPETRRAERAASLHMKYIPAGWSAKQPLPAKDKVLLGFRDLYSPLTLSGIVLSAGYSHLTDGQPNYGVNSEAFGKRLGASILRDSTEGIFTDAVFAPLLHEDPRYYVEGPDYGFLHRTLYSITRPLVTRTDSGHSSVNGAMLLGYASASALSYTYYPQINRNFHDTAATFGGGIGGAALGFFVSEFSADVLHKLHLGKLL